MVPRGKGQSARPCTRMGQMATVVPDLGVKPMRHEREPSINHFTDLARWGMLGAYLLLMYAARGNRKELRRLHDTIIPASCRLLREDYLLFEQRFEAHTDTHEWSQGGLLPLSDNLFVGDFNIARMRETDTFGQRRLGHATLCRYYAQVLNKDRERSTREEFSTTGARMILGSTERFGHGSYHFHVYLRDLDQRFGCSVHRDPAGFFVTLMLGDIELTEPVTHYLRNQLPPSTRRRTDAGSSSGGDEVTFLFELPDAALALSCREDDPAQSMYLLAGDGFEAALIDALRAVGVPIKNVTRLPAPEATQ